MFPNRSRALAHVDDRRVLNGILWVSQWLRSLRPHEGRNVRAGGSNTALQRDVGPTVGCGATECRVWTPVGFLRRNGLMRGNELLRYEVGDRHRREYFARQREALWHLGGSGGILGTWTARR
jgi:hypothetical protein